MNIKKVLIISPYFPPSNAADMHRVRMSLPYFKEFGWLPEIVTVDHEHSDLIKDTLLLQGVPDDIEIHRVSALRKRVTSVLGLGSLALRSLYFLRKKVDCLLMTSQYDLIYFSTTQFPVCILGAYWKKRFNIPYVIDMQDPWHSEYYRDKPQNQRPRKYWFSYRLNKFLEPIAMNKVDGIISVSKAYIEQLSDRYPRIAEIPKKVVTFGYFKTDFEIANRNFAQINLPYKKAPHQISLVYVGRGGYDMQPAIRLLFTAFKRLLEERLDRISDIRFHFIGTSYAPANTGTPTFLPLAEELDIVEYVEENTNRVSFYESLKALQCADGLIIPGSNDPAYTASKLYPYILAKKPLLGIFQPSSSAFQIINNCKAGLVANLNESILANEVIEKFLANLVKTEINIETDWGKFEEYGARRMTERQCELFNEVLC